MILVLPVLTGRHTFKLFWPVHSTFHFMSVSKGGLLAILMSKTNKKHQEHVLFLKSISPSIQQNNMASLFSLLGRFLPRQGLTIIWDRFWILDCVCNEMWQYSVSSYLDVLDTFYCSLDMCCLGMMQDLQGRWCKPSYLRRFCVSESVLWKHKVKNGTVLQNTLFCVPVILMLTHTLQNTGLWKPLDGLFDRKPFKKPTITG